MMPYRVTSDYVVWWRERYARGLRYVVQALGDSSVHILSKKIVPRKNCTSVVHGLVGVADWLEFFFFFFAIFDFFIF